MSSTIDKNSMNERMKKIKFVVNPISGTQSKELILSLLDEKIDKARYTWEVVYTERAGHAVEIAAKAAEEKTDIVVAIGGDGTINEIARSLVHTDTALGIIGDKYGLESREGMGTLGTYISGSVFGTLFYSFLAPVGLLLGFHPFALAMASGMGSASMMNAATAALTSAAPAMYSEQILAYSATSGLLTAVTGVYVEMFVALPLANWYYKRINPGIERFRQRVFKKAPEGEV